MVDGPEEFFVFAYEQEGGYDPGARYYEAFRSRQEAGERVFLHKKIPSTPGKPCYLRGCYIIRVKMKPGFKVSEVFK